MELIYPNQVEVYLSENEGDLTRYFQDIVAGSNVGRAFFSALSLADQYLLVSNRKTSAFIEMKTDEAIEITRVIQWLNQTWDQLSEDHPLRNLEVDELA